MSRVKMLPNLQARIMLEVFNNAFKEDVDTYFLLLDLDELFIYLIGGDIDKDNINDLLCESCRLDVNSYVNLIDFCSFLEVIINKSEELEYYETCHNAKIILDECLQILKNTDEYYTQHSSNLSECNDRG